MLYFGVVTSRNNVDQDGYAVAATPATYTIQVNTPTGLLEFEEVRPAWSMWPDVVDVRAARIGEPVIAGVYGENWFFMFPEQPKILECPTGQAAQVQGDPPSKTAADATIIGPQQLGGLTNGD